ncbi:MAG TPA: protein kinase, partial [Burkholderiaceae bacterium]|nr:protein kinase [Burkholderiaceae bacterium]
MTKPANWSAAAAAPDRALPPGTRIDDYEIEQTLVEGGIAIVYRAFDHALGMQIGLEEYMPEAMALRSTDGRVVLRTRIQGHAFEAGRQAFVGEAQTLARCEHPSLLRIDRVLQRNGTVYRAMRLCTGPTLLDHRRALAEPPDAATLQRWLEDLLGALAALHAEGCVHGALAPGRILLRDDGHLLLLGFDAVRAKLISGRTQDMMAAIEPSFAAPELRSPSPGQAPGPWTDLYALATTLRFCIDGELPPPATGLAAAQPACLPSEAWRRTPHAVASDAAWLRAVDACLAEAPQDRPQSVAELRHMIDEALFASTLPAWPAPRIDAPPSNDADAMPERDDGAAPAPLAPPEPAAPAGSALESAAPATPATPATPAMPATPA